MQIQEDQFAIFEGFHDHGEQAQAHEVLQMYRCLLFIVQDVCCELGRKRCLEEADRVEDATGDPLLCLQEFFLACNPSFFLNF